MKRRNSHSPLECLAENMNVSKPAAVRDFRNGKGCIAEQFPGPEKTQDPDLSSGGASAPAS